MKSRKLTAPHELKQLPMGALVVNGSKIGEEWVFKKILNGRWMLYDLKERGLTAHYDLADRHPEWGAEHGFRELNLPVYLLSRFGRMEEALKELEYWRKHKLDRWKTS